MFIFVVLKGLVIVVFIGSVSYLHLRGTVRLPLLRQMFNYSALFAPYNGLVYSFSRTPAGVYVDRRAFPELDLLRDNWRTIREEALRLFQAGHIKAAERNDDAGFGSFIKRGYLTWYDAPLPSARRVVSVHGGIGGSSATDSGSDVRPVAAALAAEPAS